MPKFGLVGTGVVMFLCLATFEASKFLLRLLSGAYLVGAIGPCIIENVQ